jgi:integrase
MLFWTRDELRRFLDLMDGDRYRPAFLFLATTGCRRSEALGLRWCDVDLEAGRASIRQTVTLIRHRIHVASRTKTGKGRMIELDADTVACLRSWRARQAQERLALGAGYEENDLVFCHPDGRPYNPDRFSRKFDRRIERWGLRRIRVHDLRHTWAVLALQAGVHIKVVSERLGHSSIAVTADIYSHVLPAMQADAAEKVAGLIFGA